jgi:hypothetical protein
MATSSVTEIEADHTIIWLDKNMGVSRNNRPSKIDFASNVNINCVPSNERSHDIDNLIGSEDPSMNEEQWNSLIKDVLKMFTDENSCIEFIDANLLAGKQPFFIVSGGMGRSAVPKICKKLSGYIYVFCGQRDLHTWTDDHSTDIEVYDDETGVFAKVLADIGIYYLKKSEAIDTDTEILDPTSSIKYLEWSRRLFTRATQLDRIGRSDYLNLIDSAMVNLRASRSNDSNNDQMDTIAQEADEG